ncbi:MAG: peroxidase family protein [Planctomycetota bacterium]
MNLQHLFGVLAAVGVGASLAAQPYRTIDGTGNNIANPEWGSTHVPFLRLAPNSYEDGAGEPRFSAANPRAISNTVFSQSGEIVSPLGTTSWIWQFGQFLDHDITLGELLSDDPISVIPPEDDPVFLTPISTNRSEFQVEGGVRQQINRLTSYLDGSAVYGSDQERADFLRTNDGTGKLKVSTIDGVGELMPYNRAVDPFENGNENPMLSADDLFLGGDPRVNEQIGLIAVHTLFVREHNYWADWVAQNEPEHATDGDAIYQRAKRITTGVIQAITYREYLPLLVGQGTIPAFTGYDDTVNAGIANEFATAAYRLGHTQLAPDLMLVDESGADLPSSPMALKDAFFIPGVVQEYGVEPILVGLITRRAQAVDSKLVDDVRNFLFFEPNPAAGGLDLATLNILRGREHGIPTYNEARIALGLSPAQSFSDVTPNIDVQQALAIAYDSVDDVDLWVGGLAEQQLVVGLLGETFAAIVTDQFTRMRDGDRFFYANDPELKAIVHGETLANVLRRHCPGYEEMIHGNVFRTKHCSADLNQNGVVDNEDFLAVLVAYGQAVEPYSLGDITRDGIIDAEDFVSALVAYGHTCAH